MRNDESLFSFVINEPCFSTTRPGWIPLTNVSRQKCLKIKRFAIRFRIFPLFLDIGTIRRGSSSFIDNLANLLLMIIVRIEIETVKHEKLQTLNSRDKTILRSYPEITA